MKVSESFYLFLKFAKFTHYVLGIYNENSTGMTLFVRLCDFILSIYFSLIPCFQIFEDGATYRGRMKSMGREVVKIHYRAALYPVIDYCHNSDQREQIISDNVKKLIEDSLFLQGPPDVNVSSSP